MITEDTHYHDGPDDFAEVIPNEEEAHHEYTVLLENHIKQCWKAINKVGSREPTDVETDLYYLLQNAMQTISYINGWQCFYD